MVDEAARLTVQHLDPDQAWFWTRAWQQREREADAELSSGQGSVYASDEDFLAALDARTKPRDGDA